MKIFLLAMTAILMAGCATKIEPEIITDSACVFDLILLSEDDMLDISTELARDILTHNLALCELCPSKNKC